MLVAATAVTAGAQPSAQALPPGPPAKANPETPDVLPDAVLLNMLDTYAIVQAQQALTITDEKYGTFAARFKKLQDIRRRSQRQRRIMIRELAQLVGPKATAPPDENAIRAQLAALRELDARSAGEIRQAYDALDEVLDARQQARFRIFEEQIEQRKLDLLVRARERAQSKKQ
jgi:Spy/CpxP family protein refolding chaperone